MQFERMLTAVVTILIGIVGVAALTALVSSQSKTTDVIQAGTGGFACMLRTAITGNNECGVSSTITFRPPSTPPPGTTPGNCFTSRNCA
jgi:hypothetical protein